MGVLQQEELRSSGKVAKQSDANNFRQVFFAGCRLKFNYNWKTAGTKKKGKAMDLP